MLTRHTLIRRAAREGNASMEVLFVTMNQNQLLLKGTVLLYTQTRAQTYTDGHTHTRTYEQTNT